MQFLDPTLNDLSPRHLEVLWRYQVVRTSVDFGAATCFVIGSLFFFSASTTLAADWLFLVGSILFAVKPTVDGRPRAIRPSAPAARHGATRARPRRHVMPTHSEERQ